MKKLLLAVVMLALLGVGSTANSQIAVRLGLKGGVNIANASYNPDPAGVTKGTRLGLMAGGVVEIGLTPMMFIQAEPVYAQKGNKFEQGTAKQTISANFLQIPVLFKVKFGTSEVKPFVFAGPNIGFTLSANSKIEGVGPGIDGETDIKDQVSSTDFAIDFGGGVDFRLAPKVSLTGDVRYSLGLSDLNKAPNSTTSIKSNGIQILVGVLFGLGS